MGYQESFLYIEPQWKFEKLIRTYEKAEQAGYYRVAGAEPRSVVVLKQPLGSIPAGKRLIGGFTAWAACSAASGKAGRVSA